MEATQDNRTAAVSVDLDAVACYYRIHALPEPPPDRARFAVLRRCLPRFVDLFARHGVRATFFVVGADLQEDMKGWALLAHLAREGHELASHTHTHPYDFARLSPEAIATEIDRAHAAIAHCAGVAPVGFRAPGYEVSAVILRALSERGYRYDSSLFPSPAYYGAKALVMAAMRMAGRRSGSILGDPRTPFGPRFPHRPAAADILELPIAVTPIARLPVIGTSLVTAPAWLRRRLLAGALRAPFFNLELHGIDLADADGDEIPPELVARQPDLRRSLPDKLAALDETLTAIRASGARFLPLAEAASSFAR